LPSRRESSYITIPWISTLTINLETGWPPKGLAPAATGKRQIQSSIKYVRTAIYRVRVTVVGPQGTPVDDAKVWSSMGGEPKKVAGGWQFDIPAASRPANGKLTVWASLDAAFLKGSQEVQLDADHNPAVSIPLGTDQPPASAAS
jgi:hypothetical protein